MTTKYVTLLSEAEYVRMQRHIPLLECWWWLRSSRYMEDDGDKNNDCNCPDRISMLGSVDRSICPIVYSSGVRPALRISDHNLIPGSKIGFRYNLWTYIGEDLLLSDYIIAFLRYDNNTKTTWNDSRLKKWLEAYAKQRLWVQPSSSVNDQDITTVKTNTADEDENKSE